MRDASQTLDASMRAPAAPADFPDTVREALDDVPGAADRLWGEQAPRLLRAALALGVPPEEAPDVVQESLLAAFRALRRFRPVILMEYAPYLLSEFGFEVDDMLGLLGELGYRVTVPGSGREIHRSEWLRDRQREGFCRVVLLVPA